jgi:hypothetical protein
MKARAIRSLLARTAILLAVLLALTTPAARASTCHACAWINFESIPLSGGELFCA